MPVSIVWPEEAASASSSSQLSDRTFSRLIWKPGTERWPLARSESARLASGSKEPSETSPMNRGEVWWVAFDPSVGSEIQKTRPAVIVSNDASNRLLTRVQVVPISSSVAKIYPSEALVSLNGEARKAAADQITTASKGRLRSMLGSLSPGDMEKVEGAILRQLGII